MAATVRWLQVHEPDVWARSPSAPAKDYLRLRMTGMLAGDPSDGSGALLLDAHTRAWSPELLAALDLAPDLLPPLHPSDAIGGARRRGGNGVGTAPGHPCAVGAADTA
ncbi:MAG: FGGY family carbohydrate kinase [Caldilineaceae bacterium]